MFLFWMQENASTSLVFAYFCAQTSTYSQLFQGKRLNSSHSGVEDLAA